MPLVRFLGFPDGETVSIAASQGGASDEATLANWNVVPTVEIAVTRAPSAAQVAPEAVWFEAVATNFSTDPAPAGSLVYDPVFHEIEYVWDFGDPGDTFAAPQNVPTQFRDANTTTGMIASHVYRQPGTYTVTCTARRVVDAETMEVEEAVSTTTVTIADPDSFWNASNTIVVAHDGDFTGAPASNWQCTNWDNEGGFWAFDPNHWMGVLHKAATPDPVSDQPVRVLFKRGGTYLPTSVSEGIAWPNGTHKYSYVYFGAWGDGAKPITNKVNALALDGRSMMWDGWDIRDTYDDVTQTGDQRTLMVLRGGGMTVVTNCDLSRASSGISVLNANHPNPHLFVVHDCTFSKLGSYGIITSANRTANWDGNGSRDRIAILGCRDVDTGSAPHSSGGGSGVGNSQGPVRLNGAEDAVIASCDFYSRYGWTGKGSWPDGVGATAEQPILRLFSSGAPANGQPNGRAVVTRCTGEGSEFFTVTSLFQDRPPFGNLVIDQAIHVASPAMSTFGVVEAGAVTIRNFLGIAPNVSGTFELASLIYFADFPHDSALTWDTTARLLEPIRLHNNSFILLREVGLTQTAFGLIDNFINYSDENTVTYAPLSPAQPRHEDIAPFDSTELWDARYLGRLEIGDNGVLQTQFAPPDGTVSLYRPQAGSPVIGTAIGLTAYSDLLGNPRLQTRSRGAIEPEQA